MQLHVTVLFCTAYLQTLFRLLICCGVQTLARKFKYECQIVLLHSCSKGEKAACIIPQFFSMAKQVYAAFIQCFSLSPTYNYLDSGNLRHWFVHLPKLAGVYKTLNAVARQLQPIMHNVMSYSTLIIATPRFRCDVETASVVCREFWFIPHQRRTLKGLRN